MNITKKLAISSTLIASLVLSPVAAFADGMTPDSFFYFFKQLVRDMNLYFADDEKEKAQLLLQYANEKAAELKVLNEASNTEYNEEQMKEIEDLLTEANKLIGGEDAEQADGTEKTDDAQQTNGDVTTEPTPTSTTTTTTTTESQDQQQQPQDEQQPEEGGEMGPAHALAVLKSLLDKLPEQGRKGVENAIKHIEKNIEKQAKKHKKHQEEEKTETEAPATTTTDATTGTTDSTTAPATDATASTTSGAAAQTPAPTTSAPTASATMPVNPDVQPQATAPAAPVTKEHHDNGLHLGWDKQKEQQEKAKEHKEENHGKDK
jgi:Domain of unknown function (DUF5667)